MSKKAKIVGIIALIFFVIAPLSAFSKVLNEDIANIAWMYHRLEGFAGGLYQSLISERYYFPGLGVVIVLALIFLIGLLVNNWLIRNIITGFEKALDKVPLVKTFYRSISDLISFFKGGSQASDNCVVMVFFQGSKVMGVISRKSFTDLPKGIGKEGEVAVYIPMSYQIGGVTVIVPRSSLQAVGMSVGEGLRFAATAGMPGQEKGEGGYEYES